MSGCVCCRVFAFAVHVRSGLVPAVWLPFNLFFIIDAPHVMQCIFLQAECVIAMSCDE